MSIKTEIEVGKMMTFSPTYQRELCFIINFLTRLRGRSLFRKNLI